MPLDSLEWQLNAQLDFSANRVYRRVPRLY